MYDWAKHLLRMVAKACLEVSGAAPLTGVLGEGLVDALPRLRRHLWQSWTTLGDEQALSVAALTHVNLLDAVAVAEAVVGEESTGRSPEDREALTRILVQVPALVQRSVRLPEDPLVVTVSAHLLPRSEIEIGAWLPLRPARFRPGESPLAGADRYLDRIVGTGVFGEAWLARNPNRPYLPPVVLRFCFDGDSARTLRRETALLDHVARLDAHPGIVRLLRTYLSVDVPCLEFEYAEGGELTNVIRQWHGSGYPAPPKTVGRMMLCICDPVAHAHGAGPPIVHRSLTPANILVGTKADGRLGIRIADFGLGGVRAAEAIRAGTDAGFLAGSQGSIVRGSATPFYASPEQLLGGESDPRDDVYALGVIWYQLLTGDLSSGAPTGTEWMKDLRDRGMDDALLDVLVNCFEPRETRIPDARGLSAAIRKGLMTCTDIEIIESRPDPSVVTDAALREAIEQSGEPWRIRHKKTGMEFLLVPPGEYMRGASPGDGGAFDSEKPAHRVRITRAFYLGRYEMTQAEWKNATGGSNPSRFTTSDRRPVEGVSHSTVTVVARRLGCRLPTEAEWEYACRAGTTGTRYGDIRSVAWYHSNSHDATHPVGRKRANALGFHDMLGNVWEWCSDWFSWDEYQSCAEGVADPQGPSSGEYRVCRGGSWYHTLGHCRASDRGWEEHDVYSVVGVRLAMDP